MSWEIVDTGKSAAEENMRLDAEFLQNIQADSKPILHLYEWEGECATYGHFVDPYKFLSPEGVKKHHLSLAKRPTGGGIVFHITDFAFSMIVPATHPAYSINTLDNYAFVNAFVIDIVRSFLNQKEQPELLPVEPTPLDEPSRHFCMAKPTKYDVILDGRKVGGGAQRRTKQGFLHQGTISLCMLPDSYLNDVLQPNTQVLQAMQHNSYQLIDFPQLQEAREEIKHLFKYGLSSCQQLP